MRVSLNVGDSVLLHNFPSFWSILRRSLVCPCFVGDPESGSPFVQEAHVGWWRVYQGAYAKVNSFVNLSCGATAVSLLGIVRSVT